MNRIYDSHAHLAVRTGVNAAQAGEQLSRELDAVPEVQKIVILPIDKLGYTSEDVAAVAKRESRVIPFCTVHPYDPNATDRLQAYADMGIFRGLKLHPRIQDFSIIDPRAIRLLQKAGELKIPVLVDCYPEYDLYRHQSLPMNYDQVCPHCPDTKIILGHMGGYRMFEAFTMLKQYPNLHVDMSLTLLYYRGSSLNQDMSFIIRNMRGNRIFFGTDYPDRGNLRYSIDQSMAEIDAMKLEPEWKEKILWRNLHEFFGFPPAT